MKNDDDLGFISPAVKVLLIVRSSHHRGGTKDMNLLSRIPVLFTDISLCSFRKHINAERGERLPEWGERDFIRSTKKIDDDDRRRVWTNNSRDDEE